MINPRKPQAKISVEPGAPGYIGCSMLAAAIGVSEYQTPFALHKKFFGESEDITEEKKNIFDMGHMLEDFIADAIEYFYGYKLRKCNSAFVHPQYSWWICHPDRIMVGKLDGKRIGVEIKSSSVYMNDRWGKEETDDIPIDYYMQCLGYMACGVCDEVHLFRFSNNRLTRYIIGYNEARVLTLEKEVSGVVIGWLSGAKPAPRTLEEVRSIWTDAEGEKTASDEDLCLCSIYDKLVADKKELESQIEETKVKIINSMEGFDTLVSPQGKKLHTYKKQTRSSINSKELRKAMPDVFVMFSEDTDYYVFR